MTQIVHETLPCGVEYAALPLRDRKVVAFQIRILAGYCSDAAEKLGLARLVDETIDKGTESLSGRALSDAFDAIGASAGSGTGRETTTYTCTVLPEHLDRAVELHAEFLRRATFPQEAVDVALDLARQELSALEDDAHGLLDKYLGRHAYGPILGRHALGDNETIARIDRVAIDDHWRVNFCSGRMVVAVAGNVEPARAGEILTEHFDGFGDSTKRGREPYPVAFAAGMHHYEKALEQQQIGVAWPGVEATHDDYPVQQVVLGILSGGMSGRLFTEVREKRGLVYWVSAWGETPRGCGLMFLGASTTAERCAQTYETLLNEVERLSGDVTEDELERAKTGILAGHETRGDSTRSRCSDLANDLFFFGKPVSIEEKIAKVERVTVADVMRYLDEYPRDQLCVVTVGPKALAANAVVAGGAKGVSS